MTGGGKFANIPFLARPTRNVVWIKAARKDFETFPPGARSQLLVALTVIAEGDKPDIAKPLASLGAGVMELALRHRSDAYRVVYVLQIAADVWVIHAFQKKSKRGIKTPKAEIDVIIERLKRLKEQLR